MVYTPPLRHVLVTGGAGYVGSHTCKALKQAGYVPVTLDDLSCGHRWAVKWGPLEEGDIGDKARVHKLFSQYRPVAVIHFAGSTLVAESMKDPASFYRNNFVKTLSLLEVVLEAGVRPFVFSSSCATYGNPLSLPLAETHPLAPVNPYGATKRCVEQLLHDFEMTCQLPYAALRYFNAAGADLDGEIGESHDPETHLIPIIMEAAAGLRPKVSVYGTDYETDDGTAIRDYVHVADLADAHVKAVKYLINGGKSDIFNLGTGSGYSVKDIIEAASQVTRRVIPIELAPRRAGDPPALIADPRKSKTVLNWSPRVSDLATILSTAWQWQMQKSALAHHER